ncbi:voltage-dependent calcium channel gamma-5 subunit isoform X3 [Apus apus]|uniref:voltage-dependent calcium channel gamma-5 subunit isoform X3 n=1 Tax=Apus apus TaxID=8895 RepID=UPI0021F89E66|nr:voltage-dependent calcium channel gamma-5 subunit isoform X3 [Apus apus]
MSCVLGRCSPPSAAAPSQAHPGGDCVSRWGHKGAESLWSWAFQTQRLLGGVQSVGLTCSPAVPSVSLARPEPPQERRQQNGGLTRVGKWPARGSQSTPSFSLSLPAARASIEDSPCCDTCLMVGLPDPELPTFTANLADFLLAKELLQLELKELLEPSSSGTSLLTWSRRTRHVLSIPQQKDQCMVNKEREEQLWVSLGGLLSRLWGQKSQKDGIFHRVFSLCLHCHEKLLDQA